MREYSGVEIGHNLFFVFHIALHFLVPALLVALFFRERWRWSFLVLVSATVIDLDHLLADPIYDPLRCSIGFHPLHSLPAIVVYAGLLLYRPMRIVAIGLLLHILLDSVDCRVNTGMWYSGGFL